jgi:mRNA-degrading endonuclease RelE of RelBE toxin-antitoxin system
MKSVVDARFRKAFRYLPPHIRKQARAAYKFFKEDPYHPSLHFKRVGRDLPIYSARVTLDYRVIGLRDGDTIVWLWIGSHDEYERILANLK